MRRATVLALMLLSVAAPVGAQERPPAPAPLPPDPIPPFVFDVRSGWPGLARDEDVATSLGVPVGDLPGRGLALVLGGQFYAARSRAVSLGIGGEMFWTAASGRVEPARPLDPLGPVLRNRWSHISPQVSLNFGSGEGWSYVTGGLGWSKLTMEREDNPQEPGERLRTLNYGGGAKWFAKKHLGLTLDLRFYSIAAQEAGTRPIPARRIATPAMRVFVFSGGISLR